MRFYLMLFLLFSFLHLQAKNYYTDNQTNQSGNGSSDSPFRSIGEAFSQLQAGDTLFIAGSADPSGRVYDENLSVNSGYSNGQPGMPVVVCAIPGQYVRIRMSNDLSVYSDHWTFEHLIFDMNGSADDAIKPKADYTRFRYCEVTNGQRDGFDISESNYTLIEYCRIHNFDRDDQYDAHGIVLSGGTGNVFRYNTIYDCKGDCIQLYNEGMNYDTVIEGNDLYTTMGSRSENAIDIKATNNCIIRGNKMHGFHDSDDSDGVALKINKDSDHIVIEDNDIYESNGGFRISGNETEDIFFHRNTVHDLHADGGEVSKYGYGIQFDGVLDIQVLNNTFANIPGPLFWIASNGAENLVMKNNLFYNTNSFKGDTDDFTGTTVVDYNGWFQCQERISGSVHAVTGTDPGFKNPEEYNYSLKEVSPAIDKGDPAFGNDYPGGRIDLGAFEYEPATSLRIPQDKLPSRPEIESNYPNPFNPSTTIAYSLPHSGQVTIDIFNVLGQQVDHLGNSWQDAGRHLQTWQAAGFPSGIYFCRLQFASHQLIRRLTLLK